MNNFIYVPQYGYDHPDKICDFDCLGGYEDETDAQEALIT